MYNKLIKTVRIGFFAGILSLICWTWAVSINLFGLFGEMPDPRTLENPKNNLASVLYSDDGELLGKYFREDRTVIKFDEIPQNLLDALQATEDIRFYEHSGIDMKATFAIVWDIIRGDPRGSSTITQQLAKNLFNTRAGDSEMTGSLHGVPVLGKVSVKTKEWILASRLEQAFTKKEIIAMYLTTVDFGRNLFGLKVAAKGYFGTTTDSLNAQQSALLVGMLKGPGLYSPVNKPENAKRRRNTVFNQMYKYNFLSKAENDSLKKTEIVLDMHRGNHHTGPAPYFRTVVRNQLVKWCKENGYDLFGDGLRIYTTIDSKMQQYAEEAMIKHMSYLQPEFFKEWKNRKPWVDKNYREIKGYLGRVQKRTDRYRALRKQFGDDTAAINKVMRKPLEITVFDWKSPGFEKDTVLSPIDSIAYYKHFLHMGMVSMDPFNGQIKAWVGGVNHKYFQFDNVSLPRQPGSTFKPIIYMAAIKDHGFSPCDLVYDSPQTIPLSGGGTWTARNSGGGYSNRQMTLRTALAKSVNSVAAFLMKKVKPANAVSFAKKLGINSPLNPVPALCLGSSDVSVLELTGAYATFVNKGRWIEPHYIKEIRDKNGKVIFRKQPKTTQPLSEEHAYQMVHMLRGGAEIKGGTSQGLWRYDFRKNNQVGGKTGTTSNQTDGWYIGITKGLVTGVRVSGEESAIHFRGMRYGQGARAAMPAFGIFMDKVFADSTLVPYNEKGDFAKPDNLEVELDCSKYLGIPEEDSTLYILPTAGRRFDN